MKNIEKFFKLQDAEEYFDFFAIEYDKNLIDVKRFHILKEYGNLIKKGFANFKDEAQLFDFLKFSLLRVYFDFKNGYSPSAAEVWKVYDSSKSCTSGCGGC